MQGSTRERHCAHCNKDVFNFAAMKSKDVTGLLAESKGRLCARITYKSDGAVSLLDQQSRPGAAAGVVLAASVLLAGSINAQETSHRDSSTRAVLTGYVLRPDGQTPWANASVMVTTAERTVASVKADQKGAFEVEVDPGTYDIAIWGNPLFRTRVPNAELHAGLQSMQPIQLRIAEETQEFVTMGEVVAIVKYPISYLFKHPLAYLKNLRHNF